MIIALFIVLGIGFLIVGHELGHFLVAKLFGMPVEEFGVGFPPRIFGRRKGGTLYSLNWLPFGGFVKITGEGHDPEEFKSVPAEHKKKLFMFQPAWRRILVIVAGVVVNFILGWLLLVAVYLIGTPKLIFISEVQKESPAATAGFVAGDVILSFASQEGEWVELEEGAGAASEQFATFTKDSAGKKVSFKIMREGEELVLEASPRVQPQEGEGALGVAIEELGITRLSPLNAMTVAFEETLVLIKLTYEGLGELLFGVATKGEVPSGVVGPVGIFTFAYDTARIGLVYLLRIFGLISLNLAVLNLLPFPVLDGGQLVMILVEKAKGSPLRPKTRLVLNALGMTALLLLMVVVSARDILKLFS